MEHLAGHRSATGRAALLALADQRLPTGGHTHSGGVEQAVRDGLVHDAGSLGAFLERRLRTAGLVAAGLAAAALTIVRAADRTALAVLDAEADARIPSPAQRVASRAQGRGLLRLARAGWPAGPAPGIGYDELGGRPHHSIALGATACAAGLAEPDAAVAAAYLAVTGPATAAQRLLALDPIAVAAVTLRLAERIDAVAAGALGSSRPAELPDDSDPLLDLLAERHAAAEGRLFAS